jgi:hypothetical protein
MGSSPLHSIKFLPSNFHSRFVFVKVDFLREIWAGKELMVSRVLNRNYSVSNEQIIVWGKKSGKIELN